MDLKDLIGKHILTGVDFDSEKINLWGDEFEDCTVCRFALDGVIYIATEDPDDGYRSCMRELIVDDSTEIKNSFPSCEVLGVYRDKGSYGDIDDILELIDINTGKVVLEIGTSSTDDYYPSFVANFNPMAMSINQNDQF